MARKPYFFLARYYLANLIFSKLGGLVTDLRIANMKSAWDELRARYGGQDSWLVVGNGPSLTIADLEALSALPSIASNKINLLYATTKWRPTLYTIVDHLVLFKLGSRHFDDFPLLLTSSRGYLLARTKNKMCWKMVGADGFDAWRKEVSAGLNPVTTGFLDGFTVTVANIQIAMWLGAKTVFVIGCDHFYKEEANDGVKKLAHDSAAANHFHPDYRKPGEVVNNAPIQRMNEAYRRMQLIAEDRGVRIINITRKTALDAFERATVEDAAMLTAGSPSGGIHA